MSFAIKLYQISAPEKKIDKSLSSAHEREITGVLYQDVEDINAPRIELDSTIFTHTGSECDFWSCNYAYISEMSRYYYITGKTIVDNDHAVLQLRTDVLKTYATAIKNTTAWIERSASAGSWYLPDGMIPMSAEMYEAPGITVFSPFTPGSGSIGISDHRYVIAVAGGDSGDGLSDPTDWCWMYPTHQCVRYYGLTLDQLQKFAAAINDGTSLGDWLAGDPKTGVFSVHALPFNIGTQTATNIWVGKKDLGAAVTGGPINNMYYTSTSDYFTLTTPPDFRCATSDVSIDIFLPMIGWKSIDPLMASYKKYLKIAYKVNVLTGQGTCTVYLNNTNSSSVNEKDIINIYEFNCAVEIPLTLDTTAEKRRSMASTTMAAVLSVGGAIAAKNPAMLSMAIGNSAASYANQLLNPVTYREMGSTTGGNTCDLNPLNVVIKYKKKLSPVLDGPDGVENTSMKNLFKACHGLRCDQAMQVSSNTGFIKCANWWMNPPSGITEAELQEIEQHMESGVIV